MGLPRFARNDNNKISMTQKFKTQFIPLFLTVITFIVLSILLYFFLSILNIFPLKQKIQLVLRPFDIIVGMTIYLKTSIDFALFMGNLMHTNPGWKKRIAIEIGTALGNFMGTLLVLGIWFFFKEAPLLMVIMITLAAFVLFKMAEEGFEKVMHKSDTANNLLHFPVLILQKINLLSKPLFNKILPKTGITATKLTLWKLLFFSLSVPFILGLDDFAGYIPLFSVINVLSFVLGVFLAHMILNIGLFASPNLTIKITKHPLVIIIGSIAFVGIGLWGLIEAGAIFLNLVYS